MAGPYSAKSLGLRPVPTFDHDPEAVEQLVKEYREAYPEVMRFALSAEDLDQIAEDKAWARAEEVDEEE